MIDADHLFAHRLDVDAVAKHEYDIVGHEVVRRVNWCAHSFCWHNLFNFGDTQFAAVQIDIFCFLPLASIDYRF